MRRQHKRRVACCAGYRSMQSCGVDASWRGCRCDRQRNGLESASRRASACNNCRAGSPAVSARRCASLAAPRSAATAVTHCLCAAKEPAGSPAPANQMSRLSYCHIALLFRFRSSKALSHVWHILPCSVHASGEAWSTKHHSVPVQMRTSPLYEPVRMLPGPPATALTLRSVVGASALFNAGAVQMHLLDGRAQQLADKAAAHQSS